MSPIHDIEWEIAKGKVIENQKNAELARKHGISHENNVSRIYTRFIEKIEQTEKDLVRAIELGLYKPTWLDFRDESLEKSQQEQNIILNLKQQESSQ